jgi:hypothetical protein
MCTAFWIAAFPQNSSGNGRITARELLRRAVNGELKAQAEDHSHWMYEVKENASEKEQVRWVVETGEGNLDRLLSVDGQVVTAEEEQQEDRRIQRLLHRTEEQKKRQHEQAEDDKQMERLFKMLPDAVLANYGERKGDLVEILFQPNPDFKPGSRADVVFHAMEGRIWIDEKEDRLAEIEGHLTKEVKFMGGLLGYLDKGGEFHVQQSEVGPGHWEVTLLHVNMHGKALCFKTIAVQENEVRSNFRQVADNLTLAQAAEELQRQCTASAAKGEMNSRTARREPTMAKAN